MLLKRGSFFFFDFAPQCGHVFPIILVGCSFLGFTYCHFYTPNHIISDMYMVNNMQCRQIYMVNLIVRAYLKYMVNHSML